MAAKASAAKKNPKEKEQEAEAPKPVRYPEKAETGPAALAEKSKSPIEDFFFGMADQSYAVSPYHQDSMLRPYNPDDLFQKRQDYGIYEQMLQDDQVSICMKIKKDLVLASGWDIVTEGDEDQDTEVKEYLEACLKEETDGPFDDQVEEILSAYEFGFSLSEKVFKTNDEGRLGLKYLRTRHPATWLIHTDEKGIIEKFEQRSTKATLAINPKSLIHYINQPKFQNPYGTSDLRTAYDAWFIKRQVTKYFAIFLEKAAGPIPVARYKNGIPQAAVTEIFNAIKSFQSKTALAIPDSIQAEFLEAKNSGDAYHAALNIFNMWIGRALFIPDLLGFQGGETGGGSYSLGKDQINVFFKHIQRRRETLERIVNMEIVRPIVVYNFGFMKKFPKWKLRAIRDEDAAELAKLWLEAVKGKVYKPTEEEVNHFRKLARFPEGEVEFAEPAAAPGAIDPETGEPIQVQNPGMPGKEPGDKDGGDSEGGKPGKVEVGGDAPPAPAKKKDLSLRVYAATPGSFSKKVDFKAIETAMDRFKDRVIHDSEPVVKRIFEDLGSQLKAKKILESQKPEKLENISLKYLGELKRVLKSNFRDAYQDARKLGERELFKFNFRAPLPDEKFLQFLESETALYMGDWEENIGRRIRVQMLRAIRDGRPLSEVLDDLDLEGTEDAFESLERWARTKFTDVMNRGRLEFFNESGVVAAYQYSAILDDRTTEICSGLHGKVFAKGTEPVPPMHFNCRSLLVPITRFEDYEVDTHVRGHDIAAFIEENIGTGFSRR